MAKQYAVNLKNGSVLHAVEGKARVGYALMSASENEEYEAWATSVRAAQVDGVQPSDYPKCPTFGPHRAAAEAVADAKAFVVTDYKVEPDPEPAPASEPAPVVDNTPAELKELLGGSND